MTTGFDIYRRGAAADHPRARDGRLFGRPTPPTITPLDPITESPDHQITCVNPCHGVDAVVTPTVSVGATELANAATSASTRL